ncbi:MAG: acetate/propionate family kinase [Gemmobacter sp.]
MTAVLVVNAGSSSLKVAVFDAALAPVADLAVAEIGGAARIGDVPVDAPDHAAAMDLVLDRLAAHGWPLPRLTAAAHRIVHGGARLTAPCQLTPAVVGDIEALVPLAPLHNPANLAGVRALAALAPALPQYGSFDTAFHATIPPVAYRYALPPEAEALGLRRYGFHGLSYAAMVAGWEGPLPPRLLAYHLGNGASACAIAHGRSVATTMGYSPLDGLTMGTRAGEIDGNAVLRLAAVYGIAGAGRILNRESGLMGLAGASDMRALAGPRGDFARAHFAYSAVRHGGSLVAAMGGLDAVAFTGGIGENDADLRAAIVAGLGYMGALVDPAANARGLPVIHSDASRVAIRLVPAREERQIAAEAMTVMASESPR